MSCGKISYHPLEQALNGIPGMKYIESNAGNDGEAELNASSSWELTQMLML